MVFVPSLENYEYCGTLKLNRCIKDTFLKVKSAIRHNLRREKAHIFISSDFLFISSMLVHISPIVPTLLIPSCRK